MVAIVRFALVAGLAISNAAFAQGAPAGPPAGSPSGPPRIMGAITAIDDSGMTLKSKDGAETRLAFKPNLKVLSVRPGKPTDITPGTTAIMVSKPQPNGPESVVIIRLIEADAITDPQGSSGPGPQPGTTMTNGKVTKATQTGAGVEFDVAYPGGTRHLLLPAGARVLDTYSVGREALKVGTSVESLLNREPDGSARTGAVMLMPPGGGPPGAGPPGAPPR